MANWYTTREALKRGAQLTSNERDATADRCIEGASRLIDSLTRRFFIPKTQTRYYPWPDPNPSMGWRLWLDQDLLSVSSLQTQAQNTTPTTITSSQYFLEPVNSPPYRRIEIRLDTTASFQAGNTTQRSIEVAGSWGYSNDTAATGTVSSGLDADATATSFVCSDSSLIDVGHTLLIEDEQLFVSDRTWSALTGITLANTLDSKTATKTVTVTAGHDIVVGETLLIDNEKMYVWRVNGADLWVDRSYAETNLGSHSIGAQIYIGRTLTVQRGVNGTTAATHADATSISRYDPPADIRQWAMAEAMSMFSEEQVQYGPESSSSRGSRLQSRTLLADIRAQMAPLYARARMATV